MKKIIFSLLLLLIVNSVNAQSNLIFYGGPGDGFSRNNYKQATASLNKGGVGDGFQVTSYQPNILGVNKGGAGDGWKETSFIQSINSLNKGGSGDGWNFTNQMPVVASLNKGGTGDGWHSKNSIPFIAQHNKGGQGDGWASTYVPTAPLPVTFLSFEAIKNKNTSLLNWKMADDKEVEIFQVERSTNAVNFIRRKKIS